jgi:hypothetical protein
MTNKKESHVDDSWGETKETSTFAVSFRVYYKDRLKETSNMLHRFIFKTSKEW